MIILTYVDAGVLIAAARGTEALSRNALDVLDDPNREFVSSIYLKLEVLPKAVYHKHLPEIELYEAFFDSVSRWANSLDTVLDGAYREACNLGLAAMDAIHVCASRSVGAEEFITTEKPGKPIHRIHFPRIISI